MSGIVNAYIMPHAPILIPEIGGIEVKKAAASYNGCGTVSQKILDDLPDTIILSSPHAPCYRNLTVISHEDMLSGDFNMFGHREIRIELPNDTELADLIIRKASSLDIPVEYSEPNSLGNYQKVHGLDHGALVPLYFITNAFRKANRNFKLIHISTPFFDSHELYELGRIIGEAAEEIGRRTVYLASGDLSHRLIPGAPAGYDPAGKIYDEHLMELLSKGDVEGILSITENEMEKAGECGTRSFIMGLGALQNRPFKAEVFSYEGPFGVGYLCAGLFTNAHSVKSSYVDLAKFTVDKHVNSNVRIEPEDFYEASGIVCAESDLQKKAGVFVSIKKNGDLRGCIGTIMPTCRNILEEIVQNAISASSEDPRFDPVGSDELDSLEFSVDVLGDPEDIDSLEQLDPKRFGVIVSRGYRRGLLLPDLEGIDTPKEQVAIALQKAGISPLESYTMQRFEVIRYKEHRKER